VGDPSSVRNRSAGRGGVSCGEAEVVLEFALTEVGQGDGAVPAAASDPLLLLEGREDGGAQAAAKVVALFAPVEAEPQ